MHPHVDLSAALHFWVGDNDNVGTDELDGSDMGLVDDGGRMTEGKLVNKGPEDDIEITESVGNVGVNMSHTGTLQ